MATLIFLDTETCGLGLDDPIWEIAAIRRRPAQPDEEFHWFAKHDTTAAEALPEPFREDHARRYDDKRALTDTPTQLKELLRPGLDGAKPHIVGAVPNFDTQRIQHQFGVTGWHHHLVDVENLMLGWLAARGQEPPIPWKSDDLSRMIGIDPEDYARHTALDDTRWVRAIFDRIIGGQP